MRHKNDFSSSQLVCIGIDYKIYMASNIHPEIYYSNLKLLTSFY